MQKNIYTELNFKAKGSLVYSKEIIDEAKNIFNQLPLKVVSIRQLIVEETNLAESFAISTIENEDLTLKQAKEIRVSAEIEERLKKYRGDKSLSQKEKYENLQFENINSVDSEFLNISFEDLTVDFLKELHQNLTIGLDDYSKAVHVPHYHPGSLRDSNRVKVGKIRQYTPPDHRIIERLLKLLFKEFSERENIGLDDILEFHLLLYAIHPFQNGNKRVVRIIESMLLHNYGYGADRMLSLSIYYKDKADSFHLFLMESLRRRDPTSFINFGIKGYFYSGDRLFNLAMGIYLNDFAKNFKHFVKQYLPASKYDNFNKALDVILELNGEFTYGEFINQMRGKKCTRGVSHVILNYLKREGILKHRGTLYLMEKAHEINEFTKKKDKFILKHNIALN